MSETKHTPLPLPRKVGGHVWLIELPGQPITVADKTMALHLVNRYNAGPLVEELVRMVRKSAEVAASKRDRAEAAAVVLDIVLPHLGDKAREVEAALKGLPAENVDKEKTP
ncbi:hypothetical protein LCGC14_2802580 [marine sediment metagenome]|uniref:Uncharacterized protein n=1 Tax=marine sediment metagenome TaxID=412755 RepID=A0A0F9AVS1_9ZZZZ